MVDKLTKKHRSWNMSRIKSKNTKPEIIVRKLLHKMGFRFRLNGRVAKRYSSNGLLIGKPDIVLAGYKTVIFIHGCFWHQHEGCSRCTMPSTNQEYWIKKFRRNKQHDHEVVAELENDGWKVMIIWECEVKINKLQMLENRIMKKLHVL